MKPLEYDIPRYLKVAKEITNTVKNNDKDAFDKRISECTPEEIEFFRFWYCILNYNKPLFKELYNAPKKYYKTSLKMVELMFDGWCLARMKEIDEKKE